MKCEERKPDDVYNTVAVQGDEDIDKLVVASPVIHFKKDRSAIVVIDLLL